MAKRAPAEDGLEVTDAPDAVIPERAAPASSLVPVPAPVPEAVADTLLCRDCKHWRRPWPASNMGECGVSRRYFSGPQMTTDLSTCSQAER